MTSPIDRRASPGSRGLRGWPAQRYLSAFLKRADSENDFRAILLGGTSNMIAFIAICFAAVVGLLNYYFSDVTSVALEPIKKALVPFTWMRSLCC